ncbi:fasciclin domain-containing protein 6 [Elsinoe australis]|uniref:Fasciclin domain-containing protein 6 n=1 Tax=Elsinoe australis TaxID=40998 RepID=A0A4U7AT71_9PEZI|nr:fasciclin domain-containing protein 6 [Elsinoe australis]
MFKTFVRALAFTAVVNAQSIVELLQQTPNLSTLLDLVDNYPDIVQALTITPNITVFAPTNDAFAELLAAQPDLGNQPDTIKAVLQYHVAPSRIPAKAIPKRGTFAPTLLTNTSFSLVTGGQRVKAQRKGRRVTLTSGGGAESRVVTADVQFDNGGIVHIIDKVLTIPADIASTATAANLTTLATALTQTNLLDTVNTLPDATVFAPTNEAFAALPEVPTGDALASVLTYHVVNGTVGYSTVLEQGQQIPTVNGASVRVTLAGPAIFINRSFVVQRDVLVKTGVVHVINRVLIPPAAGEAPAAPEGGHKL